MDQQETVDTGRWRREKTSWNSIPRSPYFSSSIFRLGDGDWTPSAHIEFSENFKIHTVVLKCGDAFQTEVETNRFIIKQAKQWVDDRLQNAPELRLKIKS
jgi:hypothetical protein